MILVVPRKLDVMPVSDNSPSLHPFLNVLLLLSATSSLVWMFPWVTVTVVQYQGEMAVSLTVSHASSFPDVE